MMYGGVDFFTPRREPGVVRGHGVKFAGGREGTADMTEPSFFSVLSPPRLVSIL
jgi:hypothetical protein